MESLVHLFEIPAKVKIMRLFLFNPEEVFELEDIARRSQESIDTVKSVLRNLEKAEFLKEKEFLKEVLVENIVKKNRLTMKKTKKVSANDEQDTSEPVYVKAKVIGWHYDQEFPLGEPLRTLLIDSELIKTKVLYKKLTAHGNIKFVILSGIFVKNEHHKADIIIVGDRLNLKKLVETIATIESEVGKELRYSFFTPEEFNYRLQMFDAYLLDIINSKHEVLGDKAEVPFIDSTE